MPRRILVFVALAAAMAALFVRLGFWQLSRLAERRANNASVAQRLAAAAAPISVLGTGDSARLRRASLMGTPDTAAEFAVTGRSRNGSPGVWIVTPVRVAGGGVVLVNRGWVYAPDAATVDFARWRERRTEFHGYTQRIGAGVARFGRGRALRQLDSAGVDSLLPYAFSPIYLVAQDSGAVDSIPARLSLPVLDDGPHLSYAIQWFCFALIAVAGSVVVAMRNRNAERGMRNAPTSEA